MNNHASTLSPILGFLFCMGATITALGQESIKLSDWSQIVQAEAPLSIKFAPLSVAAPAAQDENQAVAEYAPLGKTKGKARKMIRLSNMSGASAGDCTLLKYVGVIVAVQYDRETAVKIVGITIQTKDGSRQHINIEPKLYDDFRLPNADQGWVYTLLAKGKKVRVSAFACGISGDVLIAHNVSAI